MLQPREYSRLLRELTSGFADELDGDGHDLVVPTCPAWTLADLGRHLEAVHRWARVAVLEARDDETIEDDESLVGTALATRYRTTAGRLVSTLEDVPVGTECWTFGPAPHQAGFWQRRQTLETLIHLVDARRTRGLPDPSIDPDTAVDGVDEVVGMFFPRQVRLGRIPALHGVVRLIADDAGTQWTLTGDGTQQHDERVDIDSEPVPPRADGAAHGTVTGTAANLLLLLWKRLDLEAGVASGRLRVDGDAVLTRSVLEERLTP